MIMLCRQDFCRSHHTGLKSIVDSKQHAHEGNNCSPGTYIALYQAVHLRTCIGIHADFLHNALLRSCQRKWKALVKERVEFFTDFIEPLASEFLCVELLVVEQLQLNKK